MKNRPALRWLLLLNMMCGAALAKEPPVGIGSHQYGEWGASRSQVIARNAMAATSNPLATGVAVDILRRGGSAVDAAIAASAVVGLVEPLDSGIGGDMFAIVWDPAAKKLVGLNASGAAPLGQTLAQLRAKLAPTTEIPLKGSASVTVPGKVDGWFELHKKFGRLPMPQLLSPAIRYAREGFAVTEDSADNWQYEWENTRQHKGDIEELKNYSKLYWPHGKPPREGEVFYNPDLAHTLEQIAEGGRDAFYRGAIADTIDAYMRCIGGALRKRDLEHQHAEWIQPLCTDYRGYDVCELPPNTQGIAVLQMLNILEGFDIGDLVPGSAELLHLQIEAKRLVYEDLARYYADPRFADTPTQQLLSKTYAEQRRKLISPGKTMPKAIYGDPKLERGDTSYLTVADSDGMMISLIQSNYWGGSGLVPDGLGFVLQNRGNLFSLDPKHPNHYAPGKRPFHTIIPGFVLKQGKPWLSFGLMGGPMQPQGQVQVLINMIDFGMNVQQAGDSARYQHTGSSRSFQPLAKDGAGIGKVFVEPGVRPGEIDKLRALGHSVKTATGSRYGGYQAIMRDPDTGVYYGGSDMRKDGTALGY